jgi:hypothetical protein
MIARMNNICRCLCLIGLDILFGPRPFGSEHIPVIHMHGKLGEFWKEIDRQLRTVPYHDHPSPEAIKIAASEISVIHTANPRTKTFIAAREALREVHRIYFLGFGYNGTNLRRLRVFAEKDLSAYTIRGTSRGLSVREWNRACEVELNGTMAARPRYPVSVTAFLRNVVEID